MTPIRFKISFAGYTRTIGIRNSRRDARMFVTKVSYTGQPNYHVSKFWYNAPPAGIPHNAFVPQTFSKIAAEAVAEQLTKRWRLIDVRVEPEETDAGRPATSPCVTTA